MKRKLIGGVVVGVVALVAVSYYFMSKLHDEDEDYDDDFDDFDDDFEDEEISSED